jgi:hypothetical protein
MACRRRGRCAPRYEPVAAKRIWPADRPAVDSMMRIAVAGEQDNRRSVFEGRA